MNPQETSEDAVLTVEQVRLAVTAIAQAAGDYEAAHGLEGNLHRDVLEAIAAGAPNAAGLAANALVTVLIDFPRHCA